MPHSASSLQEAFHYLWPDEVGALKMLAESLPAKPHIVNIGAGAGTSTLALLESRPDAIVTSIDVQENDSPYGCLSAEKAVVTEAGLIARLTQICADSKELGANWLKPVDMVFIDGNHSYKGCKGDIQAWLINLKPGGIMAIHDYGKAEAYKRKHDPATVPHPKPWPGVDRAVDELLIGKFKLALHVDTLIAFKIILYEVVANAKG